MDVHIEHPEDRSEHEVLPFPIGWVDPAQQILSDDEVAPLHVEPYIPVADRREKWRLWREKSGKWQAAQPNHIDPPFFTSTHEGHSAPITVRSYGFRDESGQRALHELQLAIVKAEAAL